jgi:hypothetical protein
MRDIIKKLTGDKPVQDNDKLKLESELLNDYNYLRSKAKKDARDAEERIRSRSSSPFSVSDQMSAITGESDS